MCGCGQSTSGAVDVSCCANWPLNQARYFFLDNQNGSDNNVGYIDAAPGTVFTTVQAQGVAIKTFKRLREILPPIGNNRLVVILIKVRSDSTVTPGTGVYVDGITPESLNWRGISGYKFELRRGSTDLTNSVTDRVLQGGIIAIAGPAAGSAFQVDAGATTSVIPFKTAVLTDKEAIGYRIRFTSGALSGTTMFISNNGTTSLTMGTNLAGAPAQDDTFVIEMPGVKFLNYFEENDSFQKTLSTNANNTFVSSGFTLTSSASSSVEIGSINDNRYAFFHLEAVTTNFVISQSKRAHTASVNLSFLDETGTSRTVGTGVRTASPMSVVIGNLAWQSSADVSTTGSLLSSLWNYQVGGGGCYFKSGLLQFSGGAAANNGNSALANSSQRQLGNASATSRDMLIDGAGSNTNLLSGGLAGLNIQGDLSLRLVGITINNVGANPCIRVTSQTGSYDIETVSGSTGNTDVGIDLSRATNCSITLGTTTGAPTVTGTVGDIRVNGSQIHTYTNYTISSYRDDGGNFIQGSAKNTSYPAEFFCGLHVGDAGPITEYMAKYNLLLGLPAQYPSRARWYRGLSIQPRANATLAAVTVTLYKNGVATAMTVTIPAGSNALVTDFSHPIQFASGDLLDLVVTSNGATNNVFLGGFLEYT